MCSCVQALMVVQPQNPSSSASASGKSCHLCLLNRSLLIHNFFQVQQLIRWTKRYAKSVAQQVKLWVINIEIELSHLEKWHYTMRVPNCLIGLPEQKYLVDEPADALVVAKC